MSFAVAINQFNFLPRVTAGDGEASQAPLDCKIGIRKLRRAPAKWSNHPHANHLSRRNFVKFPERTTLLALPLLRPLGKRQQFSVRVILYPHAGADRVAVAEEVVRAAHVQPEFVVVQALGRERRCFAREANICGGGAYRINPRSTQ